jgi:ABC-type sugar transport system ATPase subunit
MTVMPAPPAGEDTPAIVATGLSKSFGRITALADVDLVFRPGTVTALVGENGAGKSTALGILAGRIPPTSGRVEVFGEELHLGDPRAARSRGVMAIYQELTIVPTLSAEANVFLADPPHRWGFLRGRSARERYLDLCEQMGVQPVAPNTRASTLSVAEQQVLEILRALAADARVILFDEPTAALAMPERIALLDLMRSLRGRGVASVFVSHNLDEVLGIADHVLVFRNGRLCGSGPRADFTKPRLVSAMLGDSGDSRVAAEMLAESVAVDAPEAAAAAAVPAPVRPVRSTGASPLLVAENVTVPGVIEGIDLELGAGELLGVGGLVGSGRSTLLRALAGLEPKATGSLWIKGRSVPWPRTVRQALALGVALVPEDRKSLGLVLPMSAMDNIAMADFGRAARSGFISQGSVAEATRGVGTAYGFAAARLQDPAWQLSGGNQQKLLLARWAYRRPSVLLADEPTRGIDVGAKAEILRSLEEMADTGVGIVVVSSELEEVCAVSQRAIVLTEGRLAGTLHGADTPITPEAILRLAFLGRGNLADRAGAPGHGPGMNREDAR